MRNKPHEIPKEKVVRKMLMRVHFLSDELSDVASYMRVRRAAYLADVTEKIVYIPKETLDTRFVSQVAARHYAAALNDCPNYTIVAV